MMRTEDREFLRHVIDMLWNHMTDSNDVPAIHVDDLIDEAIASHKKPDVVIDGGYVNPSTPGKNKDRIAKIRSLGFADLKALKEQCEEMMNHQQRRFPKPRNSNPELYKEQYEIWIEWFSLFNVVVLVMNEYVDKLKE